MYYGNSAATPTVSSNIWGAYTAVYHGQISGGNLYDSTSAGNNANAQSGTKEISPGVLYHSFNSPISAANNNNPVYVLSPLTGNTFDNVQSFEAWINPDTTTCNYGFPYQPLYIEGYQNYQSNQNNERLIIYTSNNCAGFYFSPTNGFTVQPNVNNYAG